jgi:hypothetical protein
MSTSGAAVVISSVALAEAIAAKTEACKATVKTYKPETATVAEMRGYAECVQRLHPNDLPGGALIVVKVAIVLVLLGAVVGAWKSYRERGYFGWFDVAMGFVMGATAVAAILFVGVLVLAGVGFLFT